MTEPPIEREPEVEDAGSDSRLLLAEQVIDAFYSFDEEALAALIGDSPNASMLTFYQGWAEGANYGVLERFPCETLGSSVRCSTMVEDDLIKALGLDFNVTDTLTFSFDEVGTAVNTIALSSNDPPEFQSAFNYTLSTYPELSSAECEGLFAGGPTPGDCALAFVASFAEFATQ